MFAFEGTAACGDSAGGLLRLFTRSRLQGLGEEAEDGVETVPGGQLVSLRACAPNNGDSKQKKRMRRVCRKHIVLKLSTRGRHECDELSVKSGKLLFMPLSKHKENWTEILSSSMTTFAGSTICDCSYLQSDEVKLSDMT